MPSGLHSAMLPPANASLPGPGLFRAWPLGSGQTFHPRVANRVCHPSPLASLVAQLGHQVSLGGSWYSLLPSAGKVWPPSPQPWASLPIPKVVRKAITTGLHLGPQGNASNPHPSQRVRGPLRPSWGLCARVNCYHNAKRKNCQKRSKVTLPGQSFCLGKSNLFS